MLVKIVVLFDYVLGGWVVFGIGVGWNVDEMEYYGVDFVYCRGYGREVVLVMC